MAATHFPTSHLGIAPYRLTIVADEVAEAEIHPAYPDWNNFFFPRGELKLHPMIAYRQIPALWRHNFNVRVENADGMERKSDGMLLLTWFAYHGLPIVPQCTSESICRFIDPNRPIIQLVQVSPGQATVRYSLCRGVGADGSPQSVESCENIEQELSVELSWKQRLKRGWQDLIMNFQTDLEVVKSFLEERLPQLSK